MHYYQTKQVNDSIVWVFLEISVQNCIEGMHALLSNALFLDLVLYCMMDTNILPAKDG